METPSLPRVLPMEAPSLARVLPTEVQHVLETPVISRPSYRASTQSCRRISRYINSVMVNPDLVATNQNVNTQSSFIVSLPDPNHSLAIFDQKFINLVETFIAADSQSPPSYTAALGGIDAEIHRLVDKTKTGSFVHYSVKPANQTVAYARIVCRLKLRLRVETEHRIRIVSITYGRTTPGDAIYTGDLAAYTAFIPTVKLLLNATVSKRLSLLTTDITYFYLSTPIETPEYMWIPYKFISTKMIARYQLENLNHSGYVLMQLHTSICCLPQAGILSQQRLIRHLASYGYTECPNTS